jgi:Tol biopolymer transport system component
MKNIRGSAFLVFCFFVLMALTFAVIPNLGAATFDPGSKWHTIKTSHFNVHYPQNIEMLAKKTAITLESVYPEVTEKWKWQPWGPTEVILVDNTDDSNGMAAVLPYNWMLIYAVPPSTDSSLAHYDDWLRMLLVHEFTHIVQIDAHGGIWTPFRLLLGKTVSPSGINPTWMREGIAQYGETVFTGGGRGRGSFSDMIIRTSVLEETFPSIDEADGLSWKPPGYKTAYVYGVKFVQWLIDTYGEHKFIEFDMRVRKSLLLGMINHQAKKIYGKTFYKLWREWEQELVNKYEKQAEVISAKDLTPHETIVPNIRYDQHYSPALSPDGTRLVYVSTSSFGPPEIRLRELATEKTMVLKKGHVAGQFSWSPDGTKIAYSAMVPYKNYYRYSDLWLYDLSVAKKKGSLKRLTKGARARSPDFTPDGKSLVFVKHDTGTDVLARMNVETKKLEILTRDENYFTQFNHPRVSHDGNFIAVSKWAPNAGWRIYRYDIDGHGALELAGGDGLLMQSRPDWSKDDASIIYASDESGVSNIYRVSSLGGKTEMITNVVTGIFQPVFLNSGRIIAQRYHSKGFEIVAYNIPGSPKGAVEKFASYARSREKKVAKKSTGSFPGVIDGEKKTSSDGGYMLGEGFKHKSADSMTDLMDDYNFNPQRYVAFGRSMFLPRFVIPNVVYADDALFFSVFTGGMDPLKWHRWTVGGTYRTDANHLGYFFDYTYNRFKPSVGAGVRDFAVDFGNLSFVDNAGVIYKTVHFYEHRRGFFTYVGLPWMKQYFMLSYYLEDHMPKTSLTPGERAALNLGKFAGLRFQYTYGDSEKYAASISRESGRTIRMFTSITNKFSASSFKKPAASL